MLIFVFRIIFLKITQMSQKIKILFRHRSMEMGGVEKVILDLLKNLPRDIFEITFFLTLNQGELRNQIPSDVETIIFQKGKEDMSANRFIRFLQLIKRNLILWFYRKNPKLLYKNFLPKEFDIEIAPTYAEFENILSSPLKSRKIAWFHTDVSYDPDQKRVWGRINQLKQFDWVIFGSRQTKDVIKTLYDIDFPNSSVIYNAIKIEEVKTKSQEFAVNYDIKPVFSSMGRLHSRKGYQSLMKIHKKLLDEGFLHSIAVIGGGSEMESLKKQAKELDVEKTFLLLDTQINPYPYILNSDYFVLPSESESYPLTIGEVMGLGIPVVSTNVGGIPEMINDRIDGFLVNPDEKSIYEGMKVFLTQGEIIENIKKNLETSVEKFDNQKIYDEVSSVFMNQFKLKK